MQIIDNKALILTVRNPQKFEIIPRSKYIGPSNNDINPIALRATYAVKGV